MLLRSPTCACLEGDTGCIALFRPRLAQVQRLQALAAASTRQHSRGVHSVLTDAFAARPLRRGLFSSNIGYKMLTFSSIDPRPSSSSALYERALQEARLQLFSQARATFEMLLDQDPYMCKAWVSYAQMEKRADASSPAERHARVRSILQRGLGFNPSSACLAQAWGLSELKAGNVWAAVRLLERCVAMDPAMSPVLRWQSVERARRNVMAASAARPRRAQSGCAISSSHSSGCSTADGSSSSNGTSTSCLSGGS